MFTWGDDDIHFGADTKVSEESAASIFRAEETSKSQKTIMLLMSTRIILG